MYVLRWLIDLWNFDFEGQILSTVLVFIAGVVIVIVGGYQFRKASTTVNPLQLEKSSQLVTNGIYRFSRNPMYVGFLLILLAWTLFLGSAIAFLLLPVFLALITKVQILPEESMLEEIFGEEYINYKKRVRRWI